jgi:hypothetical protein
MKHPWLFRFPALFLVASVAASCTDTDALLAPTDIDALASMGTVYSDPETRDDCTKGGWEGYGFHNQGLCIQFVNTGKDSRDPLVVRLGAILWLDASALPLNHGDAVAYWEDLSNNGNHAAQTDTDRMPTWVSDILNGLPIVRFDGVNDVLSTAAPVLGSSHTVFVVVKAPKADQRNGLFGQWIEGGTNRYIASLHEGGEGPAIVPHAVKAFIEGTGHFGATGAINTTHFFRTRWVKDGTTYRITIDGIERLEKLGVAAEVQQRALAIGAFNEFGTVPGRVDIAEVIAYGKVLSPDEMTAIENYLTMKYFD